MDSRLFPHCTISLQCTEKTILAYFSTTALIILCLKAVIIILKQVWTFHTNDTFLPCFPLEKSPFIKVSSFHTVSMSTMLYRSPYLELVQRRITKSPESAKSPISHFYYGRRDYKSPIFQMLYLPLRDKIDPPDDRFEDRGKTLYIYQVKKYNSCIVLHVPTSRLLLCGPKQI